MSSPILCRISGQLTVGARGTQTNRTPFGLDLLPIYKTNQFYQFPTGAGEREE